MIVEDVMVISPEEVAAERSRREVVMSVLSDHRGRRTCANRSNGRVTASGGSSDAGLLCAKSLDSRRRHQRSQTRWVTALTLLLASVATMVSGEEPQTLGTEVNPHHIPMASSAITVDGVLDEPAWEDALAIELPYETYPGYNTPARVRTVVLLTYDRKNLYLGARAYEPDASLIQAHLSDHDSILWDDQIGFELDTFNDGRRAYNFFINPFGIQEDSVAINDRFDFSWDSIWETRTLIQPWGYTAEVAIPFASIRFQRTDGPQVWGFNSERLTRRDRAYWVSAVAKDRDNSCRWCQMLKIEGFEGADAGNNVELIPALTTIQTATRDDLPSGRWESPGGEAEGALTAHWGFTRGLTLSGTLNPDFSQVEADALQLDINQPFALFYEEKRPFFSEGADFFQTEMNLVHTRTLRDPSWGLKLSGKEGTHTVGGYVVQDEVTNLLFPGSRSSAGTSLDMPNLSAALRYSKDIGSRVTIGGLATGREAEDYFNNVVGVDAVVRTTDSDVLVAQLLGSSTRYPDQVATALDQPAGEFRDGAVHVGYKHVTNKLRWWGTYEQVGDGFRADSGFMPWVGYRRLLGGFAHRWWAPSGAWWSRIEAGIDAESSDDEDGDLLKRFTGVWFEYQGTLNSSLFVKGWRGIEGYGGREFDYQDFQVTFTIWPVNSLKLEITNLYGDKIDYRNVRLGNRAQIAPHVLWNANRHLAFDMSATLERMKTDGERYYDATIAQVGADNFFTRNSSVRAILQYVDYDYRQAQGIKIAVPDDSRSLFLQLLYSYQLNPRSVLFVGYSERSVAGPDFDLTKADRTVFLKIGYSLWM